MIVMRHFGINTGEKNAIEDPEAAPRHGGGGIRQVEPRHPAESRQGFPARRQGKEGIQGPKAEKRQEIIDERLTRMEYLLHKILERVR